MRHTILAALALAAGLAPALAHEFKAGPLVIDHPWSRATPAGATVAGGYMTIANTGDKPDRLVGGSWGDGGKVEVHEMTMANGVMTMRPLAQGLPIPAGQKVELKPGSYHIMLMGLAKPLKEGQSLPGTLVFETAGTVKVDYSVGSIGGPAPAGHQHGATGH
jgi:periplasmic copper chaperone A